MKKNTKRDRTKYPGLDQKVNLKIRYDSMDQDYIDKLNDEEKDYLNRFNEEWVSANFNHSGERVHPLVYQNKVRKTTKKKVKVDVYKKDCEDRNNSRNRCSLSISKSNGMLKGEELIVPTLEKNHSDPRDIENDLIEKIDSTLIDSE